MSLLNRFAFYTTRIPCMSMNEIALMMREPKIEFTCVINSGQERRNEIFVQIFPLIEYCDEVFFRIFNIVHHVIETST